VWTPAPINIGDMPLMTVNAAGLVGLKNASVERVQTGQPPVNITFPEQTLKLEASAAQLAALKGNLSVHFNSTPAETTQVAEISPRC